MSIALGEKVLREPYWRKIQGFPLYMRHPLVGQIVYINYAHRWYTVQYEASGLKESFIMRDARRSPATVGGQNADTGRVREAVASGEGARAGGQIPGEAPGTRESRA